MKDTTGVCMWCGKPYEQHEISRPVDAPVPKMPCLGLKYGYYKREGKKQEEYTIVDPFTQQKLKEFEKMILSWHEAKLILNPKSCVKKVNYFLSTTITQAKEEGARDANEKSNIKWLNELMNIVKIFHFMLKDLYGTELADDLIARFNSLYMDIDNNLSLLTSESKEEMV